ncbi:hypothetical protein [Teredinibacter sp. KSP-S5-2]|uniref:hypothetical protein n=1 Tax=Teredinibacter sp. KSP-S5-2 TaxID=3034506 RepID=UPI0029341321|nr:hypothetical protein [Teredinibacter sp. KSP-S5-2]WNO09740.1 hypothetical protein P5V12_00940 [Teredinibacter sp. KSP-S5-2]
MKKHAIYSLLLATLASCTGPQAPSAGTDILLFLRPNHPPLYAVQLPDSIRQEQLIDNDGNAYVTSWRVSNENTENFFDAQKKCQEDIYKKQFILRAAPLHKIPEHLITPNLYKEHTTCIKGHNLELVDSEGYFPENFVLNAYRSHSATVRQQYMPVGGKIILTKPGTSFKQVYQDVKQCDVRASQYGENGVEESYPGNFIHVSIEKYYYTLAKCLEELSYQVEHLSDKK